MRDPADEQAGLTISIHVPGRNLGAGGPFGPNAATEQGTTLFPMLETLAIVLVCLWLLGIVSSYTMGGFIHALLIVAFISILVRIIRGDKPFA